MTVAPDHPTFPTDRLDERRQFFAERMRREGWTTDDIDLLEALEDRVTRIFPGTLLVPPPGGPDEWTQRLLTFARFALPEDPRVVNGKPRECHSNVSRKWLAQKTKRYRIVTGYCLDTDGLWRRHSWMTDATGRITETTSKRVAYLGVELSDTEAERFAATNTRKENP